MGRGREHGSLSKPAFILPVIFFISGVIRFVATGIFLPKFKEVLPVEPIRHRELIFRVSHIRPIAGATFSLFTGLFRERREGEKEDVNSASSP